MFFFDGAILFLLSKLFPNHFSKLRWLLVCLHYLLDIQLQFPTLIIAFILNDRNESFFTYSPSWGCRAFTRIICRLPLTPFTRSVFQFALELCELFIFYFSSTIILYAASLHTYLFESFALTRLPKKVHSLLYSDIWVTCKAKCMSKFSWHKRERGYFAPIDTRHKNVVTTVFSKPFVCTYSAATEAAVDTTIDCSVN